MQLEREERGVEVRVKMPLFDGDSCGTIEHLEPLPLRGDDHVARPSPTGAVVQLHRHLGEETTSR